MKQIYYAWKTLLHQRGASAIKVVSVGIGLGMAALLLASVAYTRSFDRHFPDSDRLYQLWMEWGFDGNTTIPSLRCVGKIAGGVLDAMPDVVEYAATARDTRNSVFVGDVMHESNTLYADSLIFKTLGTEVLRGDAVKELAQPDAVFVSDAMARRLFGDDDPVGKRVTRCVQGNTCYFDDQGRCRGVAPDVLVPQYIELFLGGRRFVDRVCASAQ